MVLPPPTNAAWGSGQEEVRLEKLLGPADALVEREAGNAEEEEEEEEQEEEEEEEQEQEEEEGGGNTIDSHGKVAGGAEEEEEFEDYRVIIESMQKAGQQWIMLSYCWGKRDKKTGQYDMQQTVIKVFRRLVKEHGLPVWLDIFGGMGGDVYESMGRGVRGAAVVVPFLSSAYDTSANGKRELKFACNLDKPLVPVMAEAGFNHSKDSNWLGVCVAGELYYPIENKSELEFERQIDDLAAAIKKQLQGMDLQLAWRGATSAPRMPTPAANAVQSNVRKTSLGGSLLAQQTPAEAARDMNAVASLLYQNSLSRYAQVFSEEGYDDVDDLRRLAEMEGEEWRMLLMRSKMKPPHIRGLRSALGVSATKEATPPGSTPTPSRRKSSRMARLSESITIKEYPLNVAATPAAKKQFKAAKKKEKVKAKDALIASVTQLLCDDVSNLCDTFVAPDQLRLPFLPEDDGSLQKHSVYDSAKHILVAVHIVTVHSTKGGLFSKGSLAMAVTGKLYCLQAHDGEGRQALVEIDNEKNEARRNFAIEQLAKKLLLPALPEEEYLLVLSRSDYESCHQKCLNANPRVHPYNGDELAHQQELKTFHFHGMGSRYSTKVLYRLYPDTRKRTFVPVPEYHQVVFEAKRAEFFEVARQLRAKTIGTKSDEGNVSSKGVNASVGTDVGSVGGAASKSEQQQRNQGMKQEFRRPKNGKPAFDQDMVHFYHDESDWKAMVNGRMDVEGAQTSTYDCKFAYTAEKSVSGNLEVGLKGIGGLNFGGESANSLSIDETCTVTFWDGDEEA
jgi:hypothetical protein